MSRQQTTTLSTFELGPNRASRRTLAGELRELTSVSTLQPPTIRGIARLRALIRAETAHARPRRIDKASYIYFCGQQDDSLYVVDCGRVKVCIPTESGKLCLLEIYVEGDLFGEAGLGGSTRTDMAAAMKPSVVRQISRASLLDALQRHGLVDEFMTYLATRVSEQQRVITDLVTASSERRLAASLLRLGRKLGAREGDDWRISERISCQDLSEMVGTTRSRIGFFLKRFKELELIHSQEDCFLVVHEQELEEFLLRGTDES